MKMSSAMATDWIQILREQGDLAQRAAEQVPRAISDPDLTLDLASKLYAAVERGAQAFDGIMDQMQESDVSDSMFDAAEAIEGIWAKLSVAAANKVRTMQGLDPIEIFSD
jgi:hypothetical protein